MTLAAGPGSFDWPKQPGFKFVPSQWQATMMTLRMIGLDDYTVHEDRRLVGRIRYATERSPGLWLWTCVVKPPSAVRGSWLARRSQGPLQGLLGELQGEASDRRAGE